MPTNLDTDLSKYGWYVRMADHPCSIRTLTGHKVKISKWQMVFHTNKYLGEFPGFSSMPDFNPAMPENAKYIRVGPPPELQTLDIATSTKSVAIGTPVDVVDYVEPVAPSSPALAAEYNILDDLDDDVLAEVLATARKLVTGELSLNDDEVEIEKVGPSLQDLVETAEAPASAEDAVAIEKLKTLVSTMSNREYMALNKKSATALLDDAGVDHSQVGNNKTDLVAFIKGLTQGN